MTCPRNGRWFGGCRFEARYDVGAPPARIKFDDVPSAADFVAMVEVTKPKTYIHDICTRCGKVVQRTTKEP